MNSASATQCSTCPFDPASSTTAIWGIHAGKTRDAASLFLSKNCVALGWHSMGDLSDPKHKTYHV